MLGKGGMIGMFSALFATCKQWDVVGLQGLANAENDITECVVKCDHTFDHMPGMIPRSGQM